jgi:hypothetical protein
MTHLFGIRPWEFRLMTVGEFRQYQAWAEAHVKAKTEGGGGSG